MSSTITTTPVNNPSLSTQRGSHPDVFGAGVPPGADQGEVRGSHHHGRDVPSTPAPNLDATQLTARDVAILRSVVCCRLLTYEQVHRIAFTTRDPSITRRRLRALARAGWLSTWEAPARTGGHTRYVHATAAAIRVLLPTLAPDAPWRALVERMLPRSDRRPLALAAHAPKWLPHQREVNELLTRIVAVPDHHVLWASSWDCPFPSRHGMFALPQPDYVLIEEVDGTPRLIFGEHDRGSEPVDRFAARKVALYSALAAFPEVCEELFGLPTFRVHVSVTDPLRRSPIARLQALVETARASTAPNVFRFTLGGWLFAFPSGPIWLTTSGPPTSDALACGDDPTVVVRG